MSKWSKKKKQNSNTAGDNNKVATSPKEQMLEIPTPLPVRIEETSEEEQRYADEKDKRFEQLRTAQRLNKITAIGAIVSVFTLVALFISLSFNRQATKAATLQANTALREYQSSQRPWVSLEAKADTMTLKDNFIDVFPTMKLVNVGHSVAQHLIISPRIVLNERIDNCDVAEEQKKSLKTTDRGIIIFPNQSIVATFPAVENPPNALGDYLKSSRSSGNPSFKLVACVIYLSPVDELIHHTRITYWIKEKGTTMVGFVPNSGMHEIELAPDVNDIDAN